MPIGASVSGLFRNPFMLATDPDPVPYPAASASPKLAILIAARDEEAVIPACLQAISQLQYPAGTVTVLVGNDQSSDQTAALVQAFAARQSTLELINIEASVAGLRGKANVLAQLARHSTADRLFFTDADTQVPPGWLEGMSLAFTRSVGIVTGVTLPDGPRLFHKLQTIDWLYNLTLTHWLSYAGLPVTAMGNNMAVSREAYEAVGGYEGLPFSVAEDFALFQAIVKKGFNFRNLLDERVLATTKPVDTFRDFLHQRKRWMRGASALPGWMVALLYAQYLTLPLLGLLFWLSPGVAVGLYITRLFVQTAVLSFGLSRLRRTHLWPYALLFDVYQLLIGPLSVVFYWLPTRINWKNRFYDAY